MENENKKYCDICKKLLNKSSYYSHKNKSLIHQKNLKKSLGKNLLDVIPNTNINTNLFLEKILKDIEIYLKLTN
jgi:hypothetical protein